MGTGTMSQDNLIKKIRALLAKASDKGVTEAEATAFAAKAQELLIKNNLAMNDLSQEDVDRGGVGDSRMEDRWNSPSRKYLLSAVCEFYMCKIFMIKVKKQVIVVGRPHNVAVAIEMADYLIKTVVRLSNEWGRGKPQKLIISFRKGAMARLCARLKELTEARDKKRSANASRELVLFKSENALVQDYVDSVIKPREARKARPMKADKEVYLAGSSAARNINIQDQIEGEKK